MFKKKTFLAFFIGLTFLVSSPALADPARANRVQKEYYDNGHMRLYLKFRDEKIARKRAYYRNGKLKLDCVYQDGEPVRTVNYYENGRLFSLWTRKSGVTKYYDREGRLNHVVILSPGNANSGPK